ncbi:MAG: hypothetical protein ABIT04_04895 [Novosphingobium sp.]
MSESTQTTMLPGDVTAVTSLTAGRDYNLRLAAEMEELELLYSDGSGNPLAEELPRHLRRAAERLDELIDYLM